MIFEAPQIFTARIDVLIDGTSVNGFPVDIDIFNESLDFSPVFWESDVDVSLSGKKRSNIRGYDLLLRLDYEHTLEPDKFDAIYEQLPNAIRYDTEIRLYPDATDTERYYAVVPTSSTVQSVMYESTVKGADKPTLEFENVELLDSVASYGSPSSAGGDADTLNGFTADDFLKSDANDTYESGNTLTFNGDVNLQGVVSVGNLGGTPFSIGGVRLFENGDEQKLGVNESPEFAGLAIGNAIGDPFTVGGIRIFDAGDEQELGTSASPTFGGATFNGNFTAPNYNPNAWDDASDRAPTALSVNLSGILTLTRFNTTNLQADLEAWADTRYALDSALDPNWDTAYDRSVIGFDLVTNSLEIDRQNASTLSVNLGTWGAGLYFQKALNLSEGDPATMRNNLELGSSDSPTFAGGTFTGHLSASNFRHILENSSTPSTDLSGLPNDQFYFSRRILNKTGYPQAFGSVVGFKDVNNGYGYSWQLFAGFSNSQPLKYRQGASDTWSDWRTIYTDGFNIVSAHSARFDQGFNVSGVTVIDSSRNASFVGGTFTSPVVVPSPTLSTHAMPRSYADYRYFGYKGQFTNSTDLNSIDENGAWVNATGNGTGNTNFPTNYGVGMTVGRNENTYGQAQVHFPTSEGGRIYFRTQWNGWNGWRTIYHSGILGALKSEAGYYTSGDSVNFANGTFTGIVNINNQLRVDNGSGLPSATYATTLTNATAYFKRSNSGTRIFFGVESWDRGWIQPQHNDGTLYNLLLNPVGGNVGIGITTNPSQRLDVNGNVQADDFILT